jgi:hypothetical protein
MLSKACVSIQYPVDVETNVSPSISDGKKLARSTTACLWDRSNVSGFETKIRIDRVARNFVGLVFEEAEMLPCSSVSHRRRWDWRPESRSLPWRGARDAADDGARSTCVRTSP